MPRKKQASSQQENAKRKNRDEARKLLQAHPLYRRLIDYIGTEEWTSAPKDSWCFVSPGGYIYVNPHRLAPPEHWAFAFAHCALHLAFGHHHRGPERPLEWNTACCIFTNRFVKELGIGRTGSGIDGSVDLGGKTEEKLYEMFCRDGIPKNIEPGMGGGMPDLMMSGPRHEYRHYHVDWEKEFAEGLAQAVSSAINVVAGIESSLGAGITTGNTTPAQRARAWFINSYPLLGALAASFELIEDPTICMRSDISIAAVNAELKEIYINPAAGLTDDQCRFVMAHEFLHVGLQHHRRCQGRDEYLWNVACDYVINHWLIEMGVGTMPDGLLVDANLKGLSAEQIYDIIVKDLRKYRKLLTLRGNCDCGDIIKRKPAEWWNAADGVALDEFYRRTLAEGLAFHEANGRGYLPAGLVEEIRTLSQPPIPWDVELAQWFDHYFPPIEKRRSYARPSRRQSSTPDIPRASYVKDFEGEMRTFGIVLDTSGSMDRQLLGKALGAIVSYSIAREVPFARLVYCDAEPWDAGYVAPEDIANRVRIKGRGGTVLQPAVDLIQNALDFPNRGPILIITDADCDVLRIRHEHAFLIPEKAHLPFKPVGPVFRIR